MTGGKWEKDGNFVPGSSSTGMTDKDYGGGQCEHIIPFIDMAFIIGLNNTGFRKKAAEFFNSSGKFGVDKVTYARWQTNCWTYVYAWSHVECNQKKNDRPLIDIKISTQGRIVFDDSNMETIHKEFCSGLVNPGDKSNAWNERWRWGCSRPCSAGR